MKGWDAFTHYRYNFKVSLNRKTKGENHANTHAAILYEGWDKPDKLSQRLLLNGATFQDCHKVSNR